MIGVLTFRYVLERPGLILVDRHCVGSVFYEPIIYAYFMYIFDV